MFFSLFVCLFCFDLFFFLCVVFFFFFFLQFFAGQSPNVVFPHMFSVRATKAAGRLCRRDVTSGPRSALAPLR